MGEVAALFPSEADPVALGQLFGARQPEFQPASGEGVAGGDPLCGAARVVSSGGDESQRAFLAAGGGAHAGLETAPGLFQGARGSADAGLRGCFYSIVPG